MKHLSALALLVGLAVLPSCLATGDPGEVEGAAQVGTGVPPASAVAGPRIGIVLAHGLGGSVESFAPEIVTALRADGFYVLRDSVPPVDSVATRAAALADQIDSFIATNELDEVHVIGHSMGGLDSRYLLSTLRRGAKIKSLTTLGTPHRGSPLADLGLGITRSFTVSQQDAILALVAFLGPTVTSAQLQRALTDLTETHAPAFNAATPDVPGVTYYSYAGLSTLFGVPNIRASSACAAPGATTPHPSSLPGLLQLAGPIVSGGFALRPHDGVVPVDSAHWTGFLGCIPADHLDMTRAGAKDVEDLDVELVPFFRQLVARVAPR
ncbi:MAG: alpha/beta fold hydrolase [Kofleriaceae bacterium]